MEGAGGESGEAVERQLRVRRLYNYIISVPLRYKCSCCLLLSVASFELYIHSLSPHHHQLRYVASIRRTCSQLLLLPLLLLLLLLGLLLLGLLLLLLLLYLPREPVPSLPQ